MTKSSSGDDATKRQRKREALWLSEDDAKVIESLKRPLKARTRPAVLRKLFELIKLPEKRRKK